jgi:hypothetical protein
MGYRSEVAYVIRFRDVPLRNQFVNLILAKQDKLLLEALNHCEVAKDTPTINFYASSWKWYDSYPVVQAHHRLMAWAKELYEDDADWRFTRIGEEADDIQNDSSGGDLDDYEDSYPVTTITTSFNQDYTPYGGEECKP